MINGFTFYFHTFLARITKEIIFFFYRNMNYALIHSIFYGFFRLKKNHFMQLKCKTRYLEHDTCSCSVNLVSVFLSSHVPRRVFRTKFEHLINDFVRKFIADGHGIEVKGKFFLDLLFFFLYFHFYNFS